jgi:sugar lactone lactonase YvrE
VCYAPFTSMLHRGIVAAFVFATIPDVLTAQARIDSINPSRGPISGGTALTLLGSGFTSATLTVDRVVTSPLSRTDSQIVFRTPRHNNGIASIAVRGSGPTVYAEFLYLPPRLQDLPPGYITTVMGIGSFRGDGRPGTQAMYYADAGTNVVLGPDGAIYFSEPGAHVIRRMRPDGIVERYAGTGVAGVDSDGRIALETTLYRPRGIVFDHAGNLIFADTGNPHRIRRIDAATGIITTIAGGATAGFSGDGGPAAQALLRDPTELAIDRAGRLYILDFGNARIRRIDTNGVITTIAGNGTQGFSGDGGPAPEASFNVGVYDNGGLAMDSRGNLYLADTFNARVRKIDTTAGIITTFVADAGTVYGVNIDSGDNVYIAFNTDKPEARIRKFSAAGELLQTWGHGFGFTEDGSAALNARMGLVWRVAFDANGSLLFADAGRIRRINSQSGLLETIVGMAPHIIGETGSALATVLNDPGTDLLFLPTGELLTAEGANYFVRKTDRNGIVSVFAGNGSLTSAPIRDGESATDVSLSSSTLALAPNGDVLILTGSGVVRIDRANKIYTMTQLGHGFSGDGGPAKEAQLLQPHDITADAAGNLFIADSNNNRVRRIDAATGIITTVAGSGPGNGIEGYGRGSSCGDGGLATQTCLDTPIGVAVASDQTLYISEGGSLWVGEAADRIRAVHSAGTMTTFKAFSGIASRIRFSAAGNLFMGTLRIQPNGHVYNLGGLGVADPANIGDGGPARETVCGDGEEYLGIAIDAEGNLFCSNLTHLRIRAIRFGAILAEPGSLVTASEGTGQSAPAYRVFARNLAATVRSPAGTLENGIRVDFVAPADGPSCTFPSGTTSYSVLTDLSGRAAISCTANSVRGSYVVTATPLGLGSSVQFSLTNTEAEVRRRAVRH